MAMIVVTAQLLDALCQRFGTMRGCLIVADPDTRASVGNELFSGLKQNLAAEVLMLPRAPQPLLETAQALADRARSSPMILAIGSGTINDLCKYAAYHADIPYAVLATAPSMNGYNSATASLRLNGASHSHAARPPAAVFTDISLLAAAPKRMIQAGLGDALCRSTVEVDWRLAHRLRDVAYDDSVLEPLRQSEEILLSRTAGLMTGDAVSLQALWDMLCAGGEAMRRMGSSMPASQGEHIIAHAMEQAVGHNDVLHGEAIAVTSVIMARLQEQWLDHPSLAEHAAWIGEHRLSADKLRSSLEAAGCPTEPETIGWNKHDVARITAEAWRSRDRYGFLHFIAEQTSM